MLVQVYDNNVNQALRVLKRKLQHNGVLRDAKRHVFHLSPSEERRRKRAAAQKRARKTATKLDQQAYEPHHAPGAHYRRRR
jgi:small subunit ribosomal protein S21